LKDDLFFENDVLPARCFEKLSAVVLRCPLENMAAMEFDDPDKKNGEGEGIQKRQGGGEGE